MSSTPQFASSPKILTGSVTVANPNRDGTGTIVDIAGVGGAAPANGRKVFRIVVQSTNRPADSVLTLFINDGTNSWLFDEIDLGAPAAASTTVPGFHVERVFADLVIPSGYKLQAAVTVAPIGGAINVLAFCGELT